MAAVSKVMIRFLMVCLILVFAKLVKRRDCWCGNVGKGAGFLESGWVWVVLGKDCEIFGILREINYEIFGRKCLSLRKER